MPFVTEPTESFQPIASALTIVPDWITAAVVMPRFTRPANSSACVPWTNVEPSTPLPTMIFNPGVFAAIDTAFSKIGVIRYLPPVLFASLSSMNGAVYRIKVGS